MKDNFIVNMKRVISGFFLGSLFFFVAFGTIIIGFYALDGLFNTLLGFFTEFGLKGDTARLASILTISYVFFGIFFGVISVKEKV